MRSQPRPVSPVDPRNRGCLRRSALTMSVMILALAASPVLSVSEEPESARPAATAGDPIRCRNGAVVSVSAFASEAGVEVMRRGGNAIDAAVATAFALAVTYPEAGNIGGGGYMLIAPSKDGTSPVFVDFREVAPRAATREMFVRPEGRSPHRRVGVPGTVRGLALAHQKHGKLAWKNVVSPAVTLAREGFAIDAAVARSINGVLKTSAPDAFAELHRVFGKPGGGDWTAGDRLIQPDLATALETIAEEGADAFYRGEPARQLVAEMRRGGGVIDAEDLARYQARLRQPVHGTYRGHDIWSSPPSSSGGTTLILMLQMLEPYELRKSGRWSPEALHRMIETMRRAYRDRAEFLADPDFAEIPKKLLSRDYARELAETIDGERASSSRSIAGSIPLKESEQTTHFSVIDRDRTAVSVTYTLESSWGSRVVVPGAGFVLNDEMNDFNWLPGVTDASGRIGTPPNEVAPGKRPLSSMCPTIVMKDNRPVLITGSPGGRTIINTVLQIVLNVVEFEMDVRSAVDAPRLHHQWFPDRVRVESAFERSHPHALEGLRQRKHKLDLAGRQGDAHTIWIDPRTGEIVGAADRRISGHAAGW